MDESWGLFGKLVGTSWTQRTDKTSILTRYEWDAQKKAVREVSQGTFLADGDVIREREVIYRKTDEPDVFQADISDRVLKKAARTSAIFRKMPNGLRSDPYLNPAQGPKIKEVAAILLDKAGRYINFFNVEGATDLELTLRQVN